MLSLHRAALEPWLSEQKARHAERTTAEAALAEHTTLLHVVEPLPARAVDRREVSHKVADRRARTRTSQSKLFLCGLCGF